MKSGLALPFLRQCIQTRQRVPCNTWDLTPVWSNLEPWTVLGQAAKPGPGLDFGLTADSSFWDRGCCWRNFSCWLMQGQNLLSGSDVWTTHMDMGTRGADHPLPSGSWAFLWSLMLAAARDEVLGCMGLSMLLLRYEGEQLEPGWVCGADSFWRTSAFFSNFFLSGFPLAHKSCVQICPLHPLHACVKNWKGQSWGKWEGNKPQGRLSSGRSIRHTLHSLSQQPPATYPIGNRQVSVNVHGGSVALPQEELRPDQKAAGRQHWNQDQERSSQDPRQWTSLKIKIALRGNNKWTSSLFSLCLTLDQYLWCNCFYYYHHPLHLYRKANWNTNREWSDLWD